MQYLKIDIYISDLLYKYDCVVIPNFGGFVANYASAKIQPIQHRLTPPSKRISFNKNLKTNDGLLSNHIAERKSLSYQQANELINAFVTQSINGLNNGDRIQIEKVGTLFLDSEKNIQFIAEEKNDFLLGSFGLTPMRVQPIIRQKPTEKIAEEAKKVIPLVKEERKRKRYWYSVAVIVLLLFGAYFLTVQNTWLSSTEIHYSNLFPSTGAKEFTYSQISYESFTSLEEEPKQKLIFKEGIVPYVTSDKEKTLLFVDNRNITTIDNTRVIGKALALELKFHVMGGCFSNKTNAKNLVKQLQVKGYKAKLLGKFKRLYAVSFGSFSSDKEARDLLSTVREKENSDAWLLVKRF